MWMTSLMMILWIAFATDSTVAPLTPRIEQAVVLGSADQLTQCRDALRAADSSEARYTLAYVDWRLYTLSLNSHDKRGPEFLQEAEKLLEALVKREPDNAEAHALLSSVFGMQIAASA